jgi:hypothetical protein
MTRRGFEDYDRFQAEVLSRLVKQGTEPPTALTPELCHDELDEDLRALWNAVSSFDN